MSILRAFCYRKFSNTSGAQNKTFHTKLEGSLFGCLSSKNPSRDHVSRMLSGCTILNGWHSVETEHNRMGSFSGRCFWHLAHRGLLCAFSGRPAPSPRVPRSHRHICLPKIHPVDSEERRASSGGCP